MIPKVDEGDEASSWPEDPKTFPDGEFGVTQMLERGIGPNDIKAV
jgi:hypothetical protein